MSFHRVYERLKHTAETHAEFCRVSRQDLHDILRYFDLVEAEATALRQQLADREKADALLHPRGQAPGPHP